MEDDFRGRNHRMSVPQFGAWDGKSETNYSVVFTRARVDRKMHKDEAMARHSIGNERELLKKQYEDDFNTHDLKKKKIEKKNKKKNKKMGKCLSCFMGI